MNLTRLAFQFCPGYLKWLHGSTKIMITDFYQEQLFF